MGFWDKILKTKKVKEIKNTIKETSKNLDDKYEISDKVDGIKELAQETTEKIAKKIEYSLDGKISFDTFTKIELKIGEIKNAERIEKSKKLLKLKVDFSEENNRQIVSGIAESYNPEELIGKKALFVTNLEPRKIFGLESNGMILGVKDTEGKFSLIVPEKNCNPGIKLG